MYITRTWPQIQENEGKLTDLIIIKNNILYINNELKYEKNKWFRFSTLLNKWIFLGIGANPNYMLADSVIIYDNILFENIFESIKDTND